MDMVGFGYIGAVSPSCEIAGTKCICLFVNHYSLARGFRQYRELKMMEFLFNNVTPGAGWPKPLYTDYGSQLVSKHMIELLKSFGVTHSKY